VNGDDLAENAMKTNKSDVICIRSLVHGELVILGHGKGARNWFHSAIGHLAIYQVKIIERSCKGSEGLTSFSSDSKFTLLHRVVAIAPIIARPTTIGSKGLAR
jgi:hypothetical protein